MSWYPTDKTLAAINDGASDLIANFQDYIQRFNVANVEGRSFGGPSLYFHSQAIRGYRRLSLDEKLSDTRFFEMIYAALVSWGMHRMGDTKTKLCDFEEFRSQILEQKERLQHLEEYRIWELSLKQGEEIGQEIARVLHLWKISLSYAQLVAGTKTLHHILPDLVPPIDRYYTLGFFGINTQLPSQKSAEVIFPFVYRPFAKIATSIREQITPLINVEGNDWHTSFTKVIDNALLGSFS